MSADEFTAGVLNLIYILNFSMKNSYAAHNKALLVYTEYKPVSSR
jgi:hypothetical protein